jgi:hypothetical protein
VVTRAKLPSVLRRVPLAAAVALGALVAASITAAVAPAIEVPAAVSVPADRAASPLADLLVSDSAWLALRSYGSIDAVQGFHHELDLGSCRRRVSPSCQHSNGFAPITAFAEIELRGPGARTLIQATGYDDNDVTFADDFRAIVSLTRSLGYRQVVWVTLRENVSYDSAGHVGYSEVYIRNNAALRELVASGQYPDVAIADWAGYSRDRPEWFSDDGIHMRRLGAYAAADYISRKMAFLEGRACPNGPRPGDPLPVPCPDPDVTGPVANIAALYPVGETSPDAQFSLEWSGHGRWPNPPWWAG